MMASQQQWQQPSLFAPPITLEQVLDQLQHHPAYEWLWFMVAHINTTSSKPIKGNNRTILTSILATHVDHLSWLLGGWQVSDSWPQKEVDSLNDLSQILKQYKETLKAGPAA